MFLIGGPTKATKPSAIFLRSGDVMVMTGPSRQAYHAVPRIVLVREEPWNEEQFKKKVCEFKGEITVNEEKYIDQNKSTFSTYSLEGNLSKIGSHDGEYRMKENIENAFNEHNNNSHERKTNEDLSDNSDISDILNYIKNSRINMNVRQVLMPSMNKLPR